MFTLMFWRATFERAVSTAAQSAIALVSAAGIGLLDVDWATVGSVAGLAAAAAVLKALAAAGFGSSGPGFGSAEVLSPEPPEVVRPDGWVDEREGGDAP